MLPAALKQPLVGHPARVEAQHETDRAPAVEPWRSLARCAKYPNAPREWAWQSVFPATRFTEVSSLGWPMRERANMGLQPTPADVIMSRRG